MQSSKYRANYSCRVECISKFGFDLTSLEFRSQISVLFCHFSELNTKRHNLQNVQVSMTEFRKSRSFRT